MDDNGAKKGSESFGNVPKGSEGVSEAFRNVRKENHTLTVRDVLRLFDEKNVGITERSIVNYCRPNKYGVALLDCFLDNNERKYFITPESVERAVEEVKARKIRVNQLSGNVPKGSERFGKVPNGSEKTPNKGVGDRIKELEHQNLDLKITNRGKDYFIEQLKQEREHLIGRVEDNARLIGELENKLLQLEAPKEGRKDYVPNKGKAPTRGQTEDVEDKPKDDPETGDQSNQQKDDPIK